MLPSSTRNTKVVVDYKNGRLQLHVPFHMNNVVRPMPNRRWNKKVGCWLAPVIRANVQYLGSLQGIFEFTPEAIKAMEESKRIRMVVKSDFPESYVFRTSPKSHQTEALNKAWPHRAFALFMGMRTGKTKTSIDLVCAKATYNKVDRVLVICPMSVRKAWENQIKIHAPIDCDVLLLDTKKPKRFDKWNIEPAKLKILVVAIESLSAGSAASLCERFLLVSTKTAVVMDESTKIKSHNRNRSQTVVSLGRMAEFRYILNGTPIVQGLMDLYMQFEFLDPEIIGIGDFYSFRNRYAIMGGYEDKSVMGYQNVDELMELVAPFVYEVDFKNSVGDIDKSFQVREIEISKEQRQLYDKLKKTKVLTFDDGALEIQNPLELVLRLQEIVSGIITYRKDDGSLVKKRIEGANNKIEELLSVTTEYREQTIVWCLYREEIFMACEALRREFGESSVVEYYGDVSESDRYANLAKFQSKEARFLVGNAATGGVGTTMDAADMIIYMSNSFNYYDRVQSEERAVGHNKANKIAVIDIVAINTVEDKLVRPALQSKCDVADFVKERMRDFTSLL